MCKSALERLKLALTAFDSMGSPRPRSVKILFLLAGWLDRSRIPDPEPCQARLFISTRE